jgi:hypothetical protein
MAVQPAMADQKCQERVYECSQSLVREVRIEPYSDFFRPLS